MKNAMKILASMAIAATLAVQPASAQDAVLDQAKSAGIVGEMFNGYLGVADESRATPDLERRVEEVNAKRLAYYSQLARESGQTPATIAALTAEKLIMRADSGEPVQPGPDEDWVRKP